MSEERLTSQAHRDRGGMDVGRPFIRPAVAETELIALLEAQCSALAQALADSSMSVLALTSENVIVWAMPRALAIPQRLSDWNPSQPNQLPPPVLNWIESEDRQFCSPAGLPTPPLPLELDCGSFRVRMRLLRNDAHRSIVIEEVSSPILAEHLAALGLSKRESEVLAWVGQGQTNDEIGRILGCSQRTVKKHLERIYIKLGVENRTAAAMVAIDTAHAHRLSDTLDA